MTKREKKKKKKNVGNGVDKRGSERGRTRERMCVNERD